MVEVYKLGQRVAGREGLLSLYARIHHWQCFYDPGVTVKSPQAPLFAFETLSDAVREYEAFNEPWTYAIWQAETSGLVRVPLWVPRTMDWHQAHWGDFWQEYLAFLDGGPLPLGYGEGTGMNRPPAGTVLCPDLTLIEMVHPYRKEEED